MFTTVYHRPRTADTALLTVRRYDRSWRMQLNVAYAVGVRYIYFR